MDKYNLRRRVTVPKIEKSVVIKIQDFQWLEPTFPPNNSLRFYFRTLTLTCKCSQKAEVCTDASFDLSKARLSRANFEVVGYLWLDVLEVDINVGYRKHLTVRISIRRQLGGAQPIERVKRVTLRRVSSRCISQGVHYRRRGYNDAFDALDEALRERTQTSTKTCANINDTFLTVFVYLFVSQPNYHLETRRNVCREKEQYSPLY